MASCVKMGKFVGAKGWVGTGQGLVNAVRETVKGGAEHVDWTEVRKLGDLPGGVVRLFGEEGGWGEVHVLSFVFLAWAAAMVSKTLKVSSLFLSRLSAWSLITITLLLPFHRSLSCNRMPYPSSSADSSP